MPNPSPSPGRMVYDRLRSIDPTHGRQYSATLGDLGEFMGLPHYETYRFLHGSGTYTDEQMRQVADFFGDQPSVWFAYNLKWNETLERQAECRHFWVYENTILTSIPPQQNRVCSDCGKHSTIVIGTHEAQQSYDRVMKQLGLYS